ncbi:MAG: threonine synthase [Bacteroidales bacterium]|nr:threonine synthase [Candidatus Cryptobacteroides faecihippi]
MKFYSTRNADLRCSLKEAASMGLAPDGGLFMPESIPQGDLEKVMACEAFPEMAAHLAGFFFDEFTYGELLEMTTKAFCFDVPLAQVGPGFSTLELFHGPTFAFKDVGAGFMGQMMGRLADKGKAINVIAATSGDTGSAVANGFYKVDGVNVTVLYPKGKVSKFQESQMTTLGENIHAVAVDGCFDDCQAIVKKLLADKEFHDGYRLTSANSINILRWIPQSFYYFWAYRQWVAGGGRKDPVVVVPSGNIGNLAAGVLAKRMGLPIASFVAANNSNDTFFRYLESGEYVPSQTVPTVANAMDVSAPSNFERIQCFYGSDWSAVAADIRGCRFSDEEIRGAIREMSEKFSYLSCPHSATGYLAAKKFGVDGFWLSTAHYAKFIDVVRVALGEDIPLIEPFQSISEREGRHEEVPVSADAVRDIIASL